MLHYYVVPEPYSKHDPAHARSEAVFRFRHELHKYGLIDPNNGPSGWYPTELGRDYIERLLALPAIARDLEPANLRGLDE